MENNLLRFEDMCEYQEWICREDHFDFEKHNSQLADLEKKWNENNSSPTCSGLCQLPAYIIQDTSRTLWSQTDTPTMDAALRDGTDSKNKYCTDAQ